MSIQIYDANGNAYEADLVDGDKYRELERENDALHEALVKAMDALKAGCERERFAAWARASRIIDAARKEQP